MQGYVAAVFAAILFASGGAESAAQPSSPYAIDASVLTGPQGGELTIDVDAPSIIESVRPRLEERLGDFDVLSIDSTPMAKGDGSWRQTWQVTLAAFDKGQPRVPRFALGVSGVPCMCANNTSLYVPPSKGRRAQRRK